MQLPAVVGGWWLVNILTAGGGPAVTSLTSFPQSDVVDIENVASVSFTADHSRFSKFFWQIGCRGRTTGGHHLMTPVTPPHILLTTLTTAWFFGQFHRRYAGPRPKNPLCDQGISGSGPLYIAVFITFINIIHLLYNWQLLKITIESSHLLGLCTGFWDFRIPLFLGSGIPLLWGFGIPQHQVQFGKLKCEKIVFT